MQREPTSIRISDASGFREKPGSLSEAVTIAFEAAGITRLVATEVLFTSESEAVSTERLQNLSWALEGAARLMVLSLQIVEDYNARPALRRQGGCA